MPISPSRPLLRCALALSMVSPLAACGGGDPYQGMDAETLYRMAEVEMSEGDAENAVEVLERLHLSYGDWPRIPDASILLAQAHFENDDYLTARSEYRRFLDRFAAHPRAPEAAVGECRSLARLVPHPQRDQGYTEEAINVCGNVVVDYAGTPQAEEAGQLRADLRHTMAEKEYMNGNHYFRRRQYDSSIIYYQFVVDLYPETEFAPRALLGLFRANEAIGYSDLASEARDQLLLDYPSSPEAEELRTAGDAS
ncbi:MAG: outer membrane protein assembly factor BamD [Labilithrix sp.]|nr:outer membrane protein assembly factor BamD [Labilithrix sp.]